MAIVIASIDKMTGAEIYGHIERIKKEYLVDGKNYQIAKDEIEVFVDEINRRGKEIARKHGRRYSSVTVGYVLR